MKCMSIYGTIDTGYSVLLTDIGHGAVYTVLVEQVSLLYNYRLKD